MYGTHSSLGLPTEIRRLADSTRTTPEATAAVGCELGATRSRCCCEGRRAASLVALLSGANRAHAPVERCLEILGDIRTAGTYDLTTLPVALREVRNLIQSTAPVSGDGARPPAATETARSGV